MTIAEKILQLPRKDRRGSRVRCLLLTEGPRVAVAQRLSALAAPFARVDADQRRWMPCGLAAPAEAQLGQVPEMLSPEQGAQLTNWWLAVRRGANTPHWDLAATALVDGRAGLLLVEAKAHANELHQGGKLLEAVPTANSQRNHARITACLQEASAALNQICPGWHLTSASHYQLANRFAWAWKLAALGIPVVLIYLGFLAANEMPGDGAPFADAPAWETTLRQHSQGHVPDGVWNTRLMVGDVPLSACIRALRLPLPGGSNG